MASTSCGFGKWLYGQGASLREIDITRHIIEEIESYHDDVHEIYSEIYKIFFYTSRE
ncbi:MAG: CZB domain-containing protein [Epsilonproteobacteria bacterium]|nr:CZB domain-containing protein [Campylobacterota bacterium]